MSATPLLEARNVVKLAYGPDGKKIRGTTVQLLKDASMAIHGGQIHALIGENGAGKTTLIKGIGGALPLDGGATFIGGEEVELTSTKDARARGISVIWQEFSLAPRLSIVENMFLGQEITSRGRLDHAEMRRQAIAALAPLGLDLDPNRAVATLSTSQQQLVEIAKALNEKAQILILDEPTASLSRGETEKLFDLLHGLRRDGIGIVLVTHRFDEVFAMADCVTVMRDGLTVGTHSTEGVTTDGLIELMVGERLASQWVEQTATPGDAVLEVRDLEVAGASAPISFTVRAGEIVGLAGLVGAGRTEVARAIVGADRHGAGSITLGGVEISRWPLRRRLEEGIAFVPEDRKTQGVLLPLSVQRNLALPSWPRLGPGPHVSTSKERGLASRLATELRVVTRTLTQAVLTLSGGNQQKIAVGKWLARDRQLYILDEPTRGVDVAARRAIYELMVKIAERGGAILMISSDLPEVLNMSDRLLIMREGAIAGELLKDQATEARVLASMFPERDGVVVSVPQGETAGG